MGRPMIPSPMNPTTCAMVASRDRSGRSDSGPDSGVTQGCAASQAIPQALDSRPVTCEALGREPHTLGFRLDVVVAPPLRGESADQRTHEQPEREIGAAPAGGSSAEKAPRRPAPRREEIDTMTTDRYTTRRGIHVHRTIQAIPVKDAIEPVIQALDAHRGILLASSYEYPGRYTRWDMGFVDPPLVLVARGRGAVLLPAIADALAGLDAIEALERAEHSLQVTVRQPAAGFTEEERSR